MLRSREMMTLHKLASTHAEVHKLFSPNRHPVDRQPFEATLHRTGGVMVARQLIAAVGAVRVSLTAP